MASTPVIQVVQDLLASVNSEANTLIALKWLNNRYQELVSRVKFRHLREIGELSIPAVVDSGTISVTKGSITVTPDATAQAAWLTSPGVASHNDWYFRASQTWYRIASVNAGGATITLDSAFAETSITAGSYKIVKRYHTVNSSARWFGDFVLSRLRYSLEIISMQEMDIKFPGRVLIGVYPTHIAQFNMNSSNFITFEIYPPPSDVELIHYTYWALPGDLDISDNIPMVIDDYILKEGAMIDLFRFEKITALRKGNVEQAAVFANEEAKQRTIWERVMKDAIRTMRGVDDISLLLDMQHGRVRRVRDQQNAHDYILDTWSR